MKTWPRRKKIKTWPRRSFALPTEVHMLSEQKGRKGLAPLVISRCKQEMKFGDSFTVWESDVTCEECGL